MSTPTPSTTSSNPRAAARAAALAAAEARLRPPPAYDEDASTSTTTTTSTSNTNTRGLFSSSSAEVSPAPVHRVESYYPTERDDRDTRLKFSRMLDRGIIRDNGYKQSFECVETLLKIANNIIESDDPKYRSLKATNTLLKNKVLAAKGGQEYLIALGFRTQTTNFITSFVYTSTLKKRHELEIGVDVLREHVKTLQDRVALSAVSATAHAQSEAARRANALREIEADRELVRARATREKIAREAREKLEKEKAEREAAQEAEGVVDAIEEDRIDMLEAVTRPVNQRNDSQDAESEEGDEGEDDGELPSYSEDRESRRWGGPGRRLG